MAEMLFPKANETCKFGCYSERGLMSYFMFVALPTQMGDFLASLQFPEGTRSPFGQLKDEMPNSVIFSELDFGKKEGFGCPDGAIFVECTEPTMVFIEVKANESYAKSCRPSKEYNSTIRGQLELRGRLTHLLRTESPEVYRDKKDIQETPELKAIYKKVDKFYQHEKRSDESRRGSWRRLVRDNGVGEFLHYLEQCGDRVYFCAITKDEDNPFNASDDKLMPRCGDQLWPDAKHRFCWLSVNDIKKRIPVAAND